MNERTTPTGEPMTPPALDPESLNNVWNDFMKSITNSPTDDHEFPTTDEGLRLAWRSVHPWGPFMPENHCQVCPQRSCTIVHCPAAHWYPSVGHVCLDPERCPLDHGRGVPLEHVFLCKGTGFLHHCHTECRFPHYLTDRSEGYVCRMSGRCVGLEVCHEGKWDPGKAIERKIRTLKKQTNASYDAHPLSAASTSPQANGGGSPFPPHEAWFVGKTMKGPSHTAQQGRAVEFIYDLLFSERRWQAEEQRIGTSVGALKKSVSLYIRKKKMSHRPVHYHWVRAQVRRTMGPVSRTFQLPQPEPESARKAAQAYGVFLTRFWNLLMDQGAQQRVPTCTFSFDYVVVTSLMLMRNYGLTLEGGTRILPMDEFLRWCFPDWSILELMNIDPSHVTTTATALKTAVVLVGAKKLQESLWGSSLDPPHQRDSIASTGAA